MEWPVRGSALLSVSACQKYRSGCEYNDQDEKYDYFAGSLQHGQLGRVPDKSAQCDTRHQHHQLEHPDCPQICESRGVYRVTRRSIIGSYEHSELPPRILRG